VDGSLELTLSAGSGEVGEDVDQVVVVVIIHVVDSGTAMADPELPHHRGEVVRDGRVLDSHLEQGVPNEDIEEERRGRTREPGAHQEAGNLRPIQYVVEIGGLARKSKAGTE
jgi:hypothetical protein